jgi:uncharacterized membrane protein
MVILLKKKEILIAGIDRKSVATVTEFALKKATVLIATGSLLGFMITAGTLFFIILGMLFAVWYFYTIPFIMFEDRGILDGMKASKEFALANKSMTINIMIIPILYLFIGSFISGVIFYSVPLVNYAIKIALDSVIFAWYTIIPAYIYLKESRAETKIHKVK